MNTEQKHCWFEESIIDGARKMILAVILFKVKDCI